MIIDAHPFCLNIEEKEKKKNYIYVFLVDTWHDSVRIGPMLGHACLMLVCASQLNQVGANLTDRV